MNRFRGYWKVKNQIYNNAHVPSMTIDYISDDDPSNQTCYGHVVSLGQQGLG